MPTSPSASSSSKRSRNDDEEHWCARVARRVEDELGLQATLNFAKSTVRAGVEAGTRLTSAFFDGLPRGSVVVVSSSAVHFSLTSKIRRVDEPAAFTIDVPAAFEEHRTLITERIRWSTANATLRKLKPYKLVTQKAFRKLLVIANLENWSRFSSRTVNFDYWLERGESCWMLVSAIEL